MTEQVKIRTLADIEAYERVPCEQRWRGDNVYDLIRRTANDLGMQGFDYDHGFGIIDVENLLDALDRRDEQPIELGLVESRRSEQIGEFVHILRPPTNPAPTCAR